MNSTLWAVIHQHAVLKISHLAVGIIKKRKGENKALII